MGQSGDFGRTIHEHSQHIQDYLTSKNHEIEINDSCRVSGQPAALNSLEIQQ